jgi:death-on-curing protein
VTPSRWIPTLEDYLDLAAIILGTTAERLRPLPRIALAESAIHAPFASFGGTAAYPDVAEQAAILIRHLAQNHPLPDGNKRAAFLLTARFLDANGYRWKSQDVEVDATMVEDIAAGRAAHDDVVAWIRARTTQ